MSNNLSWIGNKVFTNPSPQNTQPNTPSITKPAPTLYQTQQNGTTSTNSDPMPPQQGPYYGMEHGYMMQGPPPSTEKGYIPYYLASNIGKNVRAEFIIGSYMYVDKTGVLIDVGINYFVLEDVNSRTHIMCDWYSVKFVTVLQS